MNPFVDKETMKICSEFYHKFYHDSHHRRMIIGINPGRFGAGITGVPFTDPIRLESICGIPNNWAKRQELSSVFVYHVIEAYGGVEAFYRNFYITAVSPLGFVKDDKNINYYDNKELLTDIKPFVIECLKKQLQFHIKTDVAYCLGDGKNYKYLSKLNDEKKYFKRLVPLSHPRFIMQYKLKSVEQYIHNYIESFRMK
jgi:hypothetical protein